MVGTGLALAKGLFSNVGCKVRPHKGGLRCSIPGGVASARLRHLLDEAEIPFTTEIKAGQCLFTIPPETEWWRHPKTNKWIALSQAAVAYQGGNP